MTFFTLIITAALALLLVARGRHQRAEQVALLRVKSPASK